MKFTDEEGKVWEWRGEYREPCIGEAVFGYNTAIVTVGKDFFKYRTPVLTYAILHPVPTIHEFGGVKFEETGEKRVVQPGEWHFDGLNLYFQNLDTYPTRLPYTILRPLQGEK